MDEARYRTGLADAGLRPAFEVEGADESILVYAACYRNAELYVLASESDRDMALRVTPARSGVPFEERLPPGRASLILVGRRDGRLLARYPAAPDARRTGHDTSDAPPARSGPATSATG